MQKVKTLEKKVLEIYQFYMENNISIKDTAKHFNTSKATLQRLFKKNDLKPRDKKQSLIQAASKRAITNIEKYGCVAPSQNQKVKEKMEQTNLKKYGSKCSLGNKEVRKKREATNIKKFGFKEPMMNKEFMKKYEEENLKKIGVKHHVCLEEVKDKRKKTLLKNTGFEVPLQNPETHKKLQQTNLKRYGVKHSLQNKEIKKRARNTCEERWGTIFPMQNETVKERAKKKVFDNQVKKIIPWLKEFGYELLEEYVGQDIKINKKYQGRKQYKIKHSCGCLFEDDLFLLPRCPKCFEYKNGTFSQIEKWVGDLIKNNGVQVKLQDRVILKGKEIDIYCPELKIGIEVNGLFYHSINNINRSKMKDPDYHQNKTIEAREAGVKLIHIWEDDDLEILKSKINILCRKQSEKFFARKCLISQESSNVFFKENHLRGNTSCLFSINLKYDNEIISSISFRKNSNDTLELARFATKKNYQVVGGFSKLLNHSIKHIKNNYPNIKKIMTYAEMDWSPILEDSVYFKNGFKFLFQTQPSLSYTNFSKKFSRHSFQRDKIKKKFPEIYSEDLTVNQMLAIKNIFPIYNSGNLKFELEI